MYRLERACKGCRHRVRDARIERARAIEHAAAAAPPPVDAALALGSIVRQKPPRASVPVYPVFREAHPAQCDLLRRRRSVASRQGAAAGTPQHSPRLHAAAMEPRTATKARRDERREREVPAHRRGVVARGQSLSQSGIKLSLSSPRRRCQPLTPRCVISSSRAEYSGPIDPQAGLACMHREERGIRRPRRHWATHWATRWVRASPPNFDDQRVASSRA